MKGKPVKTAPEDTDFHEALGRLVDCHRSVGKVDFDVFKGEYSAQWVAQLEKAFLNEIADQAILEQVQSEPDAQCSRGPLGPPPEIKDLKIVRFLDRGGCADVWLATAEAGHVVVKLVRDQVADVELQGLRFYKRLADDPLMGLVPIQFIGRCESTGRLFYTMSPADPLHGRSFTSEDYEPFTLWAWIQERGGLSSDEALEVAHEVLPSLGKLHSKGLVHRDIKPSNIVRCHGRWCIGDTGLLVNEESLNGSSIAGTPSYLPREEGVEGRGVDLYAFGKTLYEMLSGDVRKYPARRAEHLQPEREKQYGPIYEVADRACAENQEDRYESAQAMLEDLPKREEETVEKRRRWSVPIVLTIATVFLIAIVPVFLPKKDFSLRTEFLMEDEVGNKRPIYDGDEVPNGSKILLRYHADAKAYVYVWCDSTSSGIEESYGLFPNESLELQNPVAGGEKILLPGLLNGEEFTWLLDQNAGPQEYHVQVSSTRLSELDQRIRAMTQPSLPAREREESDMARSLAKVAKSVIEDTRGVSEFAPSQSGGSTDNAWVTVNRSNLSVHYVLRFEQVKKK